MSGPQYLAEQLVDISNEAARALHKFGPQTDFTDLEWLAVLAEEFGEVAKVVTQREVPPIGEVNNAFEVKVPSLDELREEIVQVGAVAARWLRAIDDLEYARIGPR